MFKGLMIALPITIAMWVIILMLFLSCAPPAHAGYKMNWAKALGGDENHRQNEYREQQEENQRLLEKQNDMLDDMRRDQERDRLRRQLDNEMLMRELKELEEKNQ